MTQMRDQDGDRFGSISRRGVLKYGLASGAALALSACGSDSSGGSSTAAAGTLEKPSDKPDKLTIRNWGDPWRKFWQDSAGEAFTRDTGIQIEWDTTDTNALLTKVRQAIGAGQRPPVDAMFSESVSGYLAINQDLTTPLDPSAATGIKTMTQAIAMPGSGLPDYSMMGMYTFSAPLVYRSDKVSNPDVLKSWNGLWDPMFKGGTIMLPSTYQAFSFTMASVLGVDPLTEMDQVWSKFEELKPNILGLVPDTDVVNGLISGDCWVAQTIPGNGLAAEDEGAPIGYAVPDEGNYIDRDFYYVLTNIDEPTQYYANVFANYICEAKVQTPMADELGVIPGQPDARLPKYMADMPDAFPATEEELKSCITLNLEAAAKNADQFQEKYDESLKS